MPRAGIRDEGDITRKRGIVGTVDIAMARLGALHGSLPRTRKVHEYVR